MNNQIDSFENIAKDAVELLTAIVLDLRESDDPSDQLVAEIVGITTESFCIRAIKLGGE